MSAQRNLENSCYLTPSQLVMKEMWEIYLLLFYEQALFPHCSLFNWQGMVSKWRLLLERSCRKWRLVRKYPTMCCLLGCPGSQALEEVNLHYRTLLTALFLLECVNWTDFRHSSKKLFYFFSNILHLLWVPYVDWDRYHFKLCSHILFHSPPLGSHAIPLFRGGRCVKFQ